MRLTIIPTDGLVNKDNYSFRGLDLSTCSIPDNVHALQWYETEGEVEFVTNSDRTKPTNEIVSDLPPWANACVQAWTTAKDEEEARIAAELAKQEAAETPKTDETIPVTQV